MSQEVATVHILALIPIFLPTEAEQSTVSREGVHSQLCILWIRSLLYGVDPESEDAILTPLCFALINASIAEATYDPNLLQFLREIGDRIKVLNIPAENLQKLEAIIPGYLKVRKSVSHQLKRYSLFPHDSG